MYIRPFEPSDQTVVRDLILAGLEEHWGTLDLSLNPDLNDIAASYAAGDFLTGWQRGRLVATGALLPAGNDSAQIVRMSVVRDLRRAGLGRQMLGALVDCARRRLIRRLVLETTASWSEVITFYQRNGFHITHELDGNVYFELWMKDGLAA
jgi:putative acetyltransferase